MGESRKSKNNNDNQTSDEALPQDYSFLIFNDKEQDPQDVRLAAKFWKQFELEPQIESRLVSKDNISQNRSASRPTETGNMRVRTSQTRGSETSRNIVKLNRSNSQTNNSNNNNSRPQTRTISVSDMVKQLKQTNKFLNRNSNDDEENSPEFIISDNEATIENEMQQLDKFDEKLTLETTLKT